MERRMLKVIGMVAMLLMLFQTSLPVAKAETVQTTSLQPPSNVTYTISNENDILLTWSPVMHATGYKIYQIIDGQPVLMKTTSGIASLFSNMPEGVYEFSVQSYSSQLGESELSNAVTISLLKDTEPPVTTSNVPTEWQQGDVGVELIATDIQSGVDTTYYSVNGSDFTQGSSFIVSEEGVTDVSYYSVDLSGNVEPTSTVQVKIDKTAPELSINLKDEYAVGEELVLSYNAFDQVSGIASENMTINGQSAQNGEIISFDQPGEYVINIEVQDQAGWITTYQKTIVVFIPAELLVEVSPDVINDNNGVITVTVTLPEGYETYGLNLEDITLNGVLAKSGTRGLQNQAEKGQFKFEREDFNWVPGEVILEFSGLLGNQIVRGKTVVNVK